MSRLSLVLGILLVMSLTGCQTKQGEEDDDQWRKFTATAYSVEGETSSGADTREGRTVAADHGVLPVGTVIEVRGAGPLSGRYVVQDSGPAVRGSRIDIFVEDVRQAKEFGQTEVEVRVVKMGGAAE